jgi:hypothetical protein
MSVIIGDEPVNSGNTGWTKSDVLTALEKVFYELGWNSGTQKNGVPVCCKYPGWSTNNSDLGTYDTENCYLYSAGSWDDCGGPAIAAETYPNRKLYIRNNGTTAYLIKEKIATSSWPSIANDTINSNTHGLPDGQEVVYAPGETVGDATKDIGGLTPDQTYYIGRETYNTFKVYPTNADALAKTNAIDITSSPQYPYDFWTPEQSNPTLNITLGTRLTVVLDDDGTGGNFYFMDMAEGGYVADRRITNATSGNVVNQYVNGTAITGTGTAADPLIWDTNWWEITEDEPFNPTAISGVGYQGVYSYGYASDLNPTMKGSVVIGPSVNSGNDGYLRTNYWKYTVPASGGRSELKLRIYRLGDGTHEGKIQGITIHSVGEGWSNNEIFTIPGNAIGGTSPANDIVFGANAPETSTGAGDGTPSIHVTNLGTGQNMFQKHPNGDYGILRLENDSSKKFGTTYWSFAFNDNNYKMSINSGCGWNYLNRLGEHCPNNTSTGARYGTFQGELGMDLSQDRGPNVTDTSGRYDPRNYATSSTPTSYPLHIRYYKTQSPQDDNFAVIQFTQTVNTEIKTYFTFVIHKGPNFGTTVYDLDECWTGTYTHFSTDSSDQRYVQTNYVLPGYHYSSSYSAAEEPVDNNTKGREGSYGWCRNPDTSGIEYITRYECNIDTYGAATNNSVQTYFRNDAYDRIDAYNQVSHYLYSRRKDSIFNVGTASDYYKPIKGLPICNQLAPCPYYMPDDFVMLQVAVTPGQTEFRTGDQINVSSSEKYKVIIGDNQKDQTGLDGVTGNTAIGMLFCARIT